MLRAMPEARIDAAAQLVGVGVVAGVTHKKFVWVDMAGVVRRKRGTRRGMLRCMVGESLRCIV